ncbi:PREDICTED: ALP1, partial [Prunus dulcis]
STDEYCRLGESTALECLRKFCSIIEVVYGQWYLRSPNSSYLYRLLHKTSHRGFP